ncbi:MAG TPA: hypothetical protein VJQ44_03430 [Gemmatimonadales bacterium]|nr:hypothetical protein [Gemmatimonadales bacterium]
MTADQPRDWDRELAAIDKVIDKQRAGAPPPPTALPPGTIQRVPPVTPPPATGRGSVARTWFWTVLALALGIGLAVWPYPKACGLQLFFFLGATAVTVVAGVVGALASWTHRRGVAHLICLLVLLWAGVVGASEALPRSGYAREIRPWLCPAQPTTPAPGPAAPAPGPAAPSGAPSTQPAAPSRQNTQPAAPSGQGAQPATP